MTGLSAVILALETTAATARLGVELAPFAVAAKLSDADTLAGEGDRSAAPDSVVAAA